MNRTLKVFTPKFHILVLLPSPTQTQNVNNSLDHIYHLVSLFSLPTLFFDGFALHNDLVCQKIVTQSGGSSVVGNFSLVVAVCPVSECMGCSAKDVVADLVIHHPSPLLYFYKWGNLVPIHISLLSASVPQLHRGIGVSWGCALNFIVEVDVGAGGIGQTFFDIDPALGHGVPPLVALFSHSGGLLSAEEPPWGGNLLGFSLG